MDCSVDQTRYDLSHLEGAEDGWQQVTNAADNKPWNIYPVTHYDANTDIATLGYIDTCRGATTITTIEQNAIANINGIKHLGMDWYID